MDELKEIRTELAKSKLKLIDTVNKKLEDKKITTEDLKNISATLANVISVSDYMDRLYTGGFNGGLFGGCTTPSETNKNIKE